MLATLKREAHYQYRCGRLMLGFFARRFIHCNLQVTYRCNFRCRICDFWKTPHDAKDELTVDDIRLIGRKLNRLGTLIISLAGGEPLIREDIFDVITELNRANHFPILITNGWFVDEELAKDILRAGLQEISVSVDYRDPAKHDAQRGQSGSWERAMRALELLHRFRPDRRNRVHMISVLMDDNLDDVEDLIKLSREIGVTYLVNLYSWMRGTKESRLPAGEVTR
ncbi:MAG: radical SAM protein, partial [Planctomycetota bacterium]